METKLAESISYIQKRTQLRPQVGFVLGSGLSGFVKNVTVEHEFSFSEIPHFSGSTIEGHPGKFVVGTLEDLPVALMLGRIHAYEGHSLQQVVYPVRTMAMLGIRLLTLTNAAGGLNKKMKPGDFMVINDHLNFTGGNPLCGPNWSRGPRFVDMTEPYDRQMSKMLKDSLSKEKVRHHQGVYVGVLGPTYETAAEIRFYAKAGGHAVGMSTVAETIAARHAGIRVAGLSCITNLGTGLSKTKLSHDEVKEVAQLVEEKFNRSLLRYSQNLKKLL